MYPWHIHDIEPPKPPTVGTHYRRRGETLSWEVSEADRYEVKLLGPGSCRGFTVVGAEEFHKNWVRA